MYKPTSCNQQKFDLLSGIQGYLRASDIEYISKHVKGHQDDKVDMANLDRMTQLNIEMDYWAKGLWAEQYDSRAYFNYETHDRMWRNVMLETRVCNHVMLYLWNCIEGGKAAEYWIFKRTRFTE